MEDHSESDPREVEAARHNLNYIGLDGNIACLGRSNILTVCVCIQSCQALT